MMSALDSFHFHKITRILPVFHQVLFVPHQGCHLSNWLILASFLIPIRLILRQFHLPKDGPTEVRVMLQQTAKTQY